MSAASPRRQFSLWRSPRSGRRGIRLPPCRASSRRSSYRGYSLEMNGPSARRPADTGDVRSGWAPSWYQNLFCRRGCRRTDSNLCCTPRSGGKSLVVVLSGCSICSDVDRSHDSLQGKNGLQISGRARRGASQWVLLSLSAAVTVLDARASFPAVGLVEREVQLGALRAWLDAAGGGEGRLVFVSGVAGKSAPEPSTCTDFL